MKYKALMSILCVTVALSLVLCGCGNKVVNVDDTPIAQTTTTSTTPSTAPVTSDKTTDYCHMCRLDDGTYSFEIVNIVGSCLVSRDNLSVQPKVEDLGDRLLKVMDGNESSPNWVVFCYPEQNKTSVMYNNVLDIHGTRVAYSDYLTGSYQVFVQDAFAEGFITVKSLGDIDHGTSINAIFSDNGDLTITYTCDGNLEVMTIDLP